MNLDIVQNATNAIDNAIRNLYQLQDNLDSKKNKFTTKVASEEQLKEMVKYLIGCYEQLSVDTLGDSDVIEKIAQSADKLVAGIKNNLSIRNLLECALIDIAMLPLLPLLSKDCLKKCANDYIKYVEERNRSYEI